MRVRAIRNKFVDCPPAVAALGSPQTDTHISVGKEYAVHALSVFKGLVFLQIICDLDIVIWHPAWFFEMRNASVPKDWICNLTGDVLQMILGPDFVAADEASYTRMVELEPEPVAAFWRRVKALGQRQAEEGE